MRSLTSTVDAARNLYTVLGARTQRVMIVKTRWTGGERGFGVEQVVSEVAVLPTPDISDYTAMNRDQTSIGWQETGTLTLTQISARYTENDLLGLDAAGTPIESDEQIYWEIQNIGNATGDSPRRRFVLAGAPNYDELGFQWTVNLVRVQGDRTHAGEPSE